MGSSGKSLGARISLRLALPAALFALIVAAGVLNYFNHRTFLEVEIEREAERVLVHDLTVLQAVANDMFRRGASSSRLQLLFALYAAGPSTRAALLVDREGKVLASTRREQVGDDFRQVLPVELSGQPLLGEATMAEISKSQSGQHALYTELDLLAGIFPVSLGALPGELRSSQTGAVLLVRSTAARKTDVLGRELRRSGFFGAMFGGLTIGLGLALHFLVARRLQRIASTAERIGRGDLQARSGVSGGDEIGTLATAFDSMIDQRLKQEKTILALNEDLEERVQLRTKELEEVNAELVKAERLSTLGQLSGGVAHELRTPLGVVSNNLYFLREMLVRPDADPDIVDALDETGRAVGNSQRIITELLDYARSGGAEEVAQAFPVSQALDAAVRDARIPDAVEVAISGERDAAVVGDAGQVERILGNLLTNAVQAMDSEGRIDVRIRVIEASGRIAVEVEDNGPGIDAENPAMVFEPLFSKKNTGIGLGLALSKRYAEENGGILEVESSEGQGALFRLILLGPEAKTIGDVFPEYDAESK